MGGSEEAYSPDYQSPLPTVVIASSPNGIAFLKPSRALYCPQQKLKLPTSVYLAPHHHPLPAPPLPLPHFQLLAQASRTACSSQTPPPFFPCICQMLACSPFLQILAWLIPTNFSGLSRNGAFTKRLMRLKLQGLRQALLPDSVTRNPFA